MKTLSVFTFPFCLLLCSVFLLDEAPTRCGYPSLFSWLCTSLSAGLPRWSFLALFHFLFHLKLVCSRSATSYLATALLSARGRRHVLDLAASHRLDHLYLSWHLWSHDSVLRNLDQLLKLFVITLTRSFQDISLVGLEKQIRLLFSLQSHAPFATERQWSSSKGCDTILLANL